MDREEIAAVLATKVMGMTVVTKQWRDDYAVSYYETEPLIWPYTVGPGDWDSPKWDPCENIAQAKEVQNKLLGEGWTPLIRYNTFSKKYGVRMTKLWAEGMQLKVAEGQAKTEAEAISRAAVATIEGVEDGRA